MWLRLIATDSRQFPNQWEAKQKAISPCTRDFFRALSKFKVIGNIEQVKVNW